jgi:hypothetical protein
MVDSPSEPLDVHSSHLNHETCMAFDHELGNIWPHKIMLSTPTFSLRIE